MQGVSQEAISDRLRDVLDQLSTYCSKMWKKLYRYKSDPDKLLNELYTLPRGHCSESTRPMEVTTAGSCCPLSPFDIETLTMTNRIKGKVCTLHEGKCNPHNVQRREK